MKYKSNLFIQYVHALVYIIHIFVRFANMKYLPDHLIFITITTYVCQYTHLSSQQPHFLSNYFCVRGGPESAVWARLAGGSTRGLSRGTSASRETRDLYLRNHKSTKLLYCNASLWTSSNTYNTCFVHPTLPKVLYIL